MGEAKKIYDRSPMWLQNLMISYQGFVNHHRRWDVRLGSRLLSDLLESQWWDLDRFRTYQGEKLRELMTHVAQNVPYYADLFRREGIAPEKIESSEDLTRIPMLDKQTIREQPGKFLAGGHPRRAWNRFFTSGTTGTPLDLYSSRRSFTRIWSFVFRLRAWAGLGDPILPRRVQFTGREIVPDKKITPSGTYWRTNIPGNTLLMSTTHLSQDSVPSYVEAMRRFGPELIDGYPSALAIVARVSGTMGLELPVPQAIITSAETLLPEDRRAIERAFGCTVFNQYASSDTGAFICNCEHGALHVNPEFGICELLNSEGKPAGPGEEAEIVATSFCNREQVFVRYRIGDTVITGSSEECPCGRKMPIVTDLTGRVDDTLYVPDRGYIGRFDPIFKGLGGIYEAQIVQESLSTLNVKLVPAPEYDKSVEEALVVHLRAKVGETVEIAVEKVAQIPRGPNGKFRSVITRCRDRYPSM